MMSLWSAAARAGAAAAIAAARAGARTIVIEKNGMLGGTMTSACVNFPGLFFAWGERIIGGIPWELIERLCALDGAKLPPISYHNPKHWMEQIRIDPFLTAVLLDTLCAEAGVVVLFHTMLAEASETSAGLCLRLTCKEGTLTLHVKTAIDATGDANLVQRLGYACEKSPAQQPQLCKTALRAMIYRKFQRRSAVKNAGSSPRGQTAGLVPAAQSLQLAGEGRH